MSKLNTKGVAWNPLLFGEGIDLSHEFKTPVTAIQDAVELLLDHHDTMTKSQQLKFFKNLAKDSQRLEKLVYRLLEFAKADLKQISEEKTELIL
ncbi:MAG: histidine kinase dimerization/phospho-acceptor domain-containing protein [Mariprofundaceae bacterium]|nr:histidine kinase dimerization/phospho-acceptor domain-containing protein [Mariprofundaceae bacterium]